MSDLEYFRLQQENMEDPAAEDMPEDAEIEEEDNSPFNTMDKVLMYGFGLSCMYGAYTGMSLDWLTAEIEADTTRYPATAATTGGYDQAWALSTREVTAWKDAGMFMRNSYGVASVLFLANTFMGGNGSTVHQVFYRMTQGFALIPLMNLWQVFQIKNSYLINNWHSYYTYATNNQESWLYDPTQTTTTDEHYYDPAMHNEKLWTAVWNNLLIATVAIYAQKSHAVGWTYGLELAEEEALAGEEEEMMEEEPVEEQPQF